MHMLYFNSDKMRRVFCYETLLTGGNPHNKNLYLVSQGTQLGGGTASLNISAKITAGAIAADDKTADNIVNGVPA